jgi:hypothetical protein
MKGTKIMAAIKKAALLTVVPAFLGVAVFFLTVYVIAGESELPKASLDPPAIEQAWQQNYASINSMQVLYTHRVLEANAPAKDPNRFDNLVMWMHVERTEEGKRSHTRYSMAPDGFADPENIIEHAFDGSKTMEYSAREKTGAIYPGLINRSTETVNDLKDYMLMDLRPVTVELARQDPNATPRFSRSLRASIEKSMTKVRPNLELVADELCHVVESDYTTQGFDTQKRFWVAHKKSMLPMKYQELHGDRYKELIVVEQIASVETDNGTIWYPVKAYRTIDTELTGLVKYELTTHQFVPNVAVDNNTFTINFPNGTYVVDNEHGLEYTVGIE